MKSEIQRYNACLADYFSVQPLFFDGDLQKKPHIRKCMELPFQQTKAELWDEVTETLCNLDFIQAKAVAKMTYDLVRDFNDVLELIPDNAENIRQEKARQVRMEKYTCDLVACAKGEISLDELEIPESITPWTQEKIDAEIERLKTNPTRSDKLKDFLNFLGQESNNLQNYASEFKHFAWQQAWNFTNDGPVGRAAEKLDPAAGKTLLRRILPTRPPWNPMPQVLQILKGYTSYVTAVAITSDGKRAISGAEDDTCIVWDLRSGEALQTLKGHTNSALAVAITADGKRAISGSRDKTCIVWDLQSGETLQILKGHTNYVSTVAISADGKRAISGSRDKTCIVWDLPRGEALKILKGHTDHIDAIAITADGERAISGSMDRTCIVWDLQRGEALKILKGHTDHIDAIAITADGKRAISGSMDRTCIVWDLQSGEMLQILKGHTDYVLTVAISADGKRVISGSRDKTCIVWDLQSGEPFQTLKGHTDYVWTVAISADGKRAISGSLDKTCIVWDLQRGEALQTPKRHNYPIYAIAISTDGKRDHLKLPGQKPASCGIGKDERRSKL